MFKINYLHKKVFLLSTLLIFINRVSYILENREKNGNIKKSYKSSMYLNINLYKN